MRRTSRGNNIGNRRRGRGRGDGRRGLVASAAAVLGSALIRRESEGLAALRVHDAVPGAGRIALLRRRLVADGGGRALVLALLAGEVLSAADQLALRRVVAADDEVRLERAAAAEVGVGPVASVLARVVVTVGHRVLVWGFFAPGWFPCECVLRSLQGNLGCGQSRPGDEVHCADLHGFGALVLVQKTLTDGRACQKQL